MVDITEMTKRDIIVILKKRDGDNCCICNLDLGQDITLEHWIPRSQGGEHSIDNLKLAHEYCNKWKADRVPRADGSIPPRPKNRQQRVFSKKKILAELCTVCDTGRALLDGQICEACGSLPQPERFPRWAKKQPKDCSHGGIDWCWACSIGIYDRQSAVSHLLTGD